MEKGKQRLCCAGCGQARGHESSGARAERREGSSSSRMPSAHRVEDACHARKAQA